jgi:hypothetical protein
MRRRNVAFAFAVLAAVLVTAMVRAGGGGGQDDQRDHRGQIDRLSGLQENPDISTVAKGSVRIFNIDEDARTFEYELRYEGLEGTVVQAHIHFGKHGVNGGVTVFLCGTAAAPGPAGTPVCPPDGGVEAVVSRTVVAADILPPGTQGIEAMNFEELLDAMRSGHTYANVHSTKWPGGEIRAQITPRSADH